MVDILPKEVDRETLRTLVRRGGQLVEVLPKEEYDRVHLLGAINIPLASIHRTTADRLKWDKPVIIYSHNIIDDTSARAAWRLSSLGFTQIYRYAHGKEEWLAYGLPVEGTDARLQGAGDVANLDVPTCSRGDKVIEVREKVNKDGWDSCVVVNDDLIVLGLLRKGDLEKAPQNWSAEEAMDRDPGAFRLNAPVDDVAQYILEKGLDSALVTTPDGKLFGIIRKVELEQAKSLAE
jgi:rhodanese-related sulfurtransferase/CBS domain-containing protein